MIVPDYASPAKRLELYARALQEPLVEEKNIDQSLGHVNHAVLYNTRANSAFLKSTFPAGFASLAAKKQKFFSNDGTFLGNSGRSTITQTQPKESFMSWTRGEEMEEQIFDEDDDPYADVAGPYYRELMKMREQSAMNYIIHGNTSDCSLSAIRAPFHRPESKPNPKARYAIYDSSESFKVYNVPSALPDLNPALLKSKSALFSSHQKSKYDEWVDTQKSNESESVWLKKGNNTDYNYSPYDYTAKDKTRTERSSSALPLQAVPRPLPPMITVQLCTLSQMLRSNTALEERSFLFRKLPSDVAFDGILYTHALIHLYESYTHTLIYSYTHTLMFHSPVPIVSSPFLYPSEWHSGLHCPHPTVYAQYPV